MKPLIYGMTAGMLLLASCMGPRYQQGFSYRSSDPGMDIGSSNAPLNARQSASGTTQKHVEPHTGGSALTTESFQSHTGNSSSSPDLVDGGSGHGNIQPELMLTPETGSVTDEAAQRLQLRAMELARASIERRQSESASPKASVVLEDVTRELVAEGNIQSLSPKQEKRLQKLGRKLDRKMSGQALAREGFLGTGTMLFFAIMAIAGFALAVVFGVGIGWLVFLVFGALWLYFKLTRRAPPSL